jgi:hypothetical protein
MKLSVISAIALALASTLVVQHSATANVVLLGTGSLAATDTDLSGLSTPLEGGTAQNLLGALGSGITYSGVGNTFLAVPDRGPNATAYAGGAAVDNTQSYIARVQQLNLAITPTASLGSWTITPTLTKTTLLSNSTPLVGSSTIDNPNKTYFTGLSSGFDSTNSSNSMRLDTESIRVSNTGKTVFVSDEYGPYVYEFDRSTGQRIRSLSVPASFNIAAPAATGASELSGNTAGRQGNRGMEGLAITPNGSALYGIMQNPLIQDNALNANLNRRGINDRIVKFDTATGQETGQFLYQLDSGSANGINEMVAVNDHQFLVVERDGNAGTNALTKKIYLVDLTGATDLDKTSFEDGGLPQTGTPAGVTPVTKTLFLDLLDPQFGLAGSSFPEKIEGLAFGPEVTDPISGKKYRTLVITNDNDFLPANPNNFYVFGFESGDLNFVAQTVPEPSVYALMLAGLAGIAFVARRRHK